MDPSDTAMGEPAVSPPLMRLLFILDITASMESELQACKFAIQDMLDLLDDSCGPISFGIVTFTESNSGGCFTSCFESTSAEATQRYIHTIYLSRPPEAPGIAACGDDGPENHKAALARTTQLDPSIPTIAFLITDAAPHLGTSTASSTYRTQLTAKHELDYLARKHPTLSSSAAQDFFQCFQQTALAHFGSNLILNCVIYNTNGPYAQRPCEVQLLFASLAQQTGGMLMQPQSRDPHEMAKGLLSVVKALKAGLDGQPLPSLQQHQRVASWEGVEQHEEGGGLQGFKLIDLSGVNPARSSEQEPAGVVDFGDTQEFFSIAMDRMVAVCGKKWTKRAIGMSAPKEQLQFVWRAARYISLCAKPVPTDPTSEAQLAQSKAEELNKLLHLREVVLAALPADNRGHFSITERDLRRMVEEAEAWATADGGADAATGAVSAISLTSVGEALEDDAVWEDWLHSVMNLLLGCPIQVQLPLDAYGLPDFMDAWSAMLIRMGVDTISAAEFLQLIQDQHAAKGLTDKKDYNAFLVMPDPADKVASMVFKIASGTQALDYITSVAMGGNQGFFPNLHAGITAACLTKLLSQPAPLTDFQRSQVQQLAHALCIRHTNAAKSVTTQLLAGQANPEDHISKLLLALLRLYRRPAADKNPDTAAATAAGAAAVAAGGAGSGDKLQVTLHLVLQEWLGSSMQRFYGKLTPENNSKYYESVVTYVPVASIFSSTHGADGAQPDAKRRKITETGEPAFDPLQQLSPLETTDVSTLSTDDPLPAGIRPDGQEIVLQNMLGLHAGTPTHPVLGRFVLCAGRLLALPQSPSDAANTTTQAAVKAGLPREGSYTLESVLPGAAAALDSSWPQWKQAAFEAMLLRFRTARYTCKHEEQPPADANGFPVAATAGKPQWEPVQLPNCLSMAVARLQQALAPQLKSYWQARLQEAKKQLLQVAANVLRQHAKDPDRACTALQEVQLVLPASAGDAEHSAAHNSSANSGVPTARLLNAMYTLQRSDVPDLLELLGVACVAQPVQPGSSGDSKPPQQAKPVFLVSSTGVVTSGLLRILVLGPWCTQPAQVLKRSIVVQQLCAHFASECTDVVEAIKMQQVCGRTAGFNRKGHSASLPYPGPDGWTEEYAAARVAACGEKRMKAGQQIKMTETLHAMKQFTAMAAWAKQAAAGDAEKEAAVTCVLSQEPDARKADHVLAKLQKVLGQNMPRA